VDIALAALGRCGLHTTVPLGVIPYGTGNNLVRSFGLERTLEKALLTIAQGYTRCLDIGLLNQRYYCVNSSFGLFAHVLANRVTNSLLGYTYEAVRHLGVAPWIVRIRYIDAADRTIELPEQQYLVGAMLNTAYYGSILHMAPDVVHDDGMFDVKLIRAVPRLAYPLMFTIVLTGQYELSSHTMTFRAKEVELFLDDRCRVETDGDVLPANPHYCIRSGGQIRLLVPPG
jgi:diacylglycerol kinase family enzyme